MPRLPSFLLEIGFFFFGRLLAVSGGGLGFSFFTCFSAGMVSDWFEVVLLQISSLPGISVAGGVLCFVLFRTGIYLGFLLFLVWSPLFWRPHPVGGWRAFSLAEDDYLPYVEFSVNLVFFVILLASPPFYHFSFCFRLSRQSFPSLPRGSSGCFFLLVWERFPFYVRLFENGPFTFL